MEFLSDDVTKIKFLKLRDSLGYFERTTSERPSTVGQIVSEILVPFLNLTRFLML